eukprot:10794734-Ditylum_brightwellii.AAC.1
MDLACRFPHKPTQGNEYLYVIYDYDSIAILAFPIKNRQAKALVTAWETLHERITKHGQQHCQIFGQKTNQYIPIILLIQPSQPPGFTPSNPLIGTQPSQLPDFTPINPPTATVIKPQLLQYPIPVQPAPQKMVLPSHPVLQETTLPRVVTPATTPAQVPCIKNPPTQKHNYNLCPYTVTPAAAAEQLLRVQHYTTPLNMPAFQRVDQNQGLTSE